MPLLCEICQNLLVLDIKVDSTALYFRCNSCRTRVKGTPSDTLRFEQNNLNRIKAPWNTDLQKDQSNPIIDKVCSADGCNSKLARFTINSEVHSSGENKKIITACLKCGMQGLLA